MSFLQIIIDIVTAIAVTSIITVYYQKKYKKAEERDEREKETSLSNK